MFEIVFLQNDLKLMMNILKYEGKLQFFAFMKYGLGIFY